MWLMTAGSSLSLFGQGMGSSLPLDTPCNSYSCNSFGCPLEPQAVSELTATLGYQNEVFLGVLVILPMQIRHPYVTT